MAGDHTCIQSERIARDEKAVDAALEKSISADKQVLVILEAIKEVKGRMDKHSSVLEKFFMDFKQHKEEAEKEGGHRDRLRSLEVIVKGEDGEGGLKKTVSEIRRNGWKIALVSGFVVGVIMKFSPEIIERMFSVLLHHLGIG